MVGFFNLFIGVINSFNPTHVGVINLLCATLLMYGLGFMNKRGVFCERN